MLEISYNSDVISELQYVQLLGSTVLLSNLKR